MAAGNAERSAYPLRVSRWRDVPGLVHGFLGRVHSLGAGSFTTADLAAQLAAAGESPATVLAARQIHGAAVLGPEALDGVAPDALLPGALPAGDVLVSASAGVVLTIRTADCVPVLLVAERARAVAAVHAGWRGLLAGALAAAVAALQTRYDARPGELEAAIGPAIGGCCYEFGAEPWGALRASFGSAAHSVWRPGPDPTRGHLDLRELTRLALEQAGVRPAAVTLVGPCTAESPAELHSYRRDGAHAGRQLSYIGWRE
jgi:YfiH family protein